ncbi:DMT family transporter [Inconstantimicrobium porci]|uniref:DMT family transporter n=1 Tax=Inconstantimicrobium porci TaxID=2652291 RepID=UPI0024094F37|nr:DMT family transporter [Inconstantimicrobium porci]MDD6770760.1 DMT family transporter [Inconstantimicrobium porci]
MYQLLALLTGITLSVMISINGNLSNQYGVFLSAVIIHVVGSLSAFIMCIFKKDKKPLFTHSPKWIYLGGAIGVCSTVFNNLAYSHISMTSIVALGLLGQALTSLLIDRFGLLGMQKQNFSKTSIPGFIIAFSGMIFMLDTSISDSIIAVFVSLATGISVVLSRTVNARLAEKTGALQGSLINHLVGLPITIVIAIIAGNIYPAASVSTIKPWIYFGGILGVAVVLLFNVTVPKISAFKLTILTFIGQVFTGIGLDLIIGNNYSNNSFIGGIIISCGIAINLFFERRSTQNNA